ncbi:serglycin [Bos indicus x Bos taurus]|nr:serglycin precursor [Bos taurus]XP_027386420.1 serglycin [Bos indicus x Bos taurus]AAI02220.1 Serglycin [Bos taurus]AAW82084.1 proteoglycan 1 precursor-like [Bos taurus]DAA14236.1 TPA: serglycin [Bos taurus]
MQVLLQCARLVLALAFILFSSSVQGSPVQRAGYQCNPDSPDSNSANCIEEKGTAFDILRGESSRIPPPRTDISPLMNSKNLNEVFPLSEDISGSGSGAESGSGFLNEIEQEYQPVEENDAFYYTFRSRKRNVPSYNQDLGQDGPEEDFTI